MGIPFFCSVKVITPAFFARKDITIDVDKFALSEMLQWIWRSAIRDGRAINVYIPSHRMRELFLGWIDEVSKGVTTNEEEQD